MLKGLKQMLTAEHMKKRTVIYILLTIYLFGTLLRFVPIGYKEWKNPNWHNNNIKEIEFYYDDVARSLLVGKGFVHSVNSRSPDQPWSFEPGTPFHFVPPLYAWWVYLIYIVFGPSMFYAKSVQCLLDASVCVLIYFLGKRILMHESRALLAAGLYAIYPLAIVMCSTLYYQIPLNVLLCIIVLTYMAKSKVSTGALTGIAVGLSALAKPVTLPLLFLLPALRMVEGRFQKVSLRPAALWGVVFILSGLITLAPWTIRNYMVFNRFVPVQHGATEVLVQGSKEEYIDLDVDALRKRYPAGLALPNKVFSTAIANHMEHLRINPLDYMRFLIKKFLLTWYNTEGKGKNSLTLTVQAPFLLFALVSIFLSSKKWLMRPNWYVPALIFYFCSVQVALFPLLRYTLAVMPLMMLLAADGLALSEKRFVIGGGKSG